MRTTLHKNNREVKKNSFRSSLKFLFYVFYIVAKFLIFSINSEGVKVKKKVQTETQVFTKLGHSVLSSVHPPFVSEPSNVDIYLLLYIPSSLPPCNLALNTNYPKIPQNISCCTQLSTLPSLFVLP